MDLRENMARVNHKSTKKSKEHQTFLKDNFTKKAMKGWMIPFNLSIVHRIKGANIIPLGIADQFTIDESGKPKSKMGIIHDCSWAHPVNL